VRPLEDLLPGPVLAPHVGAGPAVSVTLDRETGVRALDDDIDAVAADVVLDGYLPVAPGHDLLQHVPLEL
jgi:hypothetical protein